MKKYAFLLMNPLFETEAVYIQVPGIQHVIIPIQNEEETFLKVKQLVHEGFGVIEVCGAFGSDLAKRLYASIDGCIPIGYVAYEPQQEKAMEAYWQSEE